MGQLLLWITNTDKGATFTGSTILGGGAAGANILGSPYVCSHHSNSSDQIRRGNPSTEETCF